MPSKQGEDPKRNHDDQALVRVAKVLMTVGSATQDPRIVTLATDAIQYLKDGNGMEALLMMLPDDQPMEQVNPMYQPRSRR